MTLTLSWRPLLALLPLLSACDTPSAPLSTPPSSMSSVPADFAAHKIPADRFWAGSEIDADSLLRAYLSSHDGVLVDAPDVVWVDQRDTLPAVAIQFGPMSAFAAAPAEMHTALVLMDLERNRGWIAPTSMGPADGDGDPEEPAAAAPSAPPPAAGAVEDRMARVHRLELRKLVGPAWEPGRFLLTAFTRDQVSNRAPITLTYSPARFNDPEAARVLAARAAKVGPAAVKPAARDPYPAYKSSPLSPQIPTTPGVTLVVPRVHEVGRGLCLVRGSFRVVARPHEVVKAEPDEIAGLDRSSPRPSAIVGIHLLVQGANDGAVSLVRMAVPSWDPIASNQAKPEVTGHFTLHLLSESGLPSGAQTLFVTALSGEHLAGPYPLALVP